MSGCCGIQVGGGSPSSNINAANSLISLQQIDSRAVVIERQCPHVHF